LCVSKNSPDSILVCRPRVGLTPQTDFIRATAISLADALRAVGGLDGFTDQLKTAQGVAQSAIVYIPTFSVLGRTNPIDGCAPVGQGTWQNEPKIDLLTF
jgi:hypothetical protein